MTKNNKDFKELEIILSDFACDKNCPYCTAKITSWDKVEDDIHLLSLNVGQLKELGYSFHYVTIGGNGEPTLHSYDKLKDIVDMFSDYDIPIKRVLTSGNIFRKENYDKYRLFVDNGWVFEVTVADFDIDKSNAIQGYSFNYFNTDAFKNAKIRLNYVALHSNIHKCADDLRKFASEYPNIITLAVKLLNVNTYDETKITDSRSKWIIENGIPKTDREMVAEILNKEFKYIGSGYDTHSWEMDLGERKAEVYFSWKKLPYGFSDLVWYGNRFVTYQLETVDLNLLPKVYIASRFIKNKLADGTTSFSNDFRAKLIGKEDDFVNFNPHSFIKDNDSNNGVVAQYLGPFWNEKASDGNLTNDSCMEVVKTESDLIEKCDIFIAYFDEETSPGGIAELVYSALLKKRIIIFFKTEKNVRYSTKSSSWYPIVFSKYINDDTIIEPVVDVDDMMNKIVDLIKQV